MSVNAKAPLKYILRPATVDESELFYSMPEEKDMEFVILSRKPHTQVVGKSC